MNPRLLRPFRAIPPPQDIFLSDQTLQENAGESFIVGSLSTTPPGVYTYAVLSGGPFDISSDFLVTTADLDFESQNSYSVTIRSTNAVGQFLDKSFTITVTDANEQPTDIALSSASIEEGNAINDVIGTFSATDPDAGDSFTYTLVSGTGDADNGDFNISGTSLRAGIVFDYATQASFSIRVQVADQGALTLEKQFTITVTEAAASGLSLWQAEAMDPVYHWSA